MKTLAVYSIKGGVGKTSTSANLAYGASQAGLRTLLVDLDPQAASSFCFRVRARKDGKAKSVLSTGERLLAAVRASDYPHLDLLPAHLTFRRFDILLNKLGERKRLAELFRALRPHYDLLVLDAPPGVTDLSENLFTASHRILVPMVPTPLSERTWSQLNDFFKDKGYPRKRLRMFFSMVDRRSRLHRLAMQALGDDKRSLGCIVPRSVDIERMAERREPVLAYAKRSAGGKALSELTAAVLADLKLTPTDTREESQR